MVGCSGEVYVNCKKCQKIFSTKMLEKEVNKALSPQADKYDITIIDFLENAKSQSSYFDYDSAPSIFVNGDLVRGVVDPEIAVGAICDSMKEPLKDCKALHKLQT